MRSHCRARADKIDLYAQFCAEAEHPMKATQYVNEGKNRAKMRKKFSKRLASESK